MFHKNEALYGDTPVSVRKETWKCQIPSGDDRRTIYDNLKKFKL